MSGLYDVLQWIMHIDQVLVVMFQHYGLWCYVILFLIVFGETGLIILPFLPGDSLLFAVGALSAYIGESSVYYFIAILMCAAILGNQCNFWIGKYCGSWLMTNSFEWKKSLNISERVQVAEQFYRRHGGKALILSRFMPILRSFAPFVAGLSNMSESRFWMFNVMGAVLWVPGLITMGFLFGNVPIVKDYFTVLICGIIIVSLLPAFAAFYSGTRERP